MQTFLISSNNTDFISRQIKDITRNLVTSPGNFIEIVPENTLKIDDVRKITQSVSLKPSGGGSRVIIIRKMDKATIEASNAFLKILEEPPENNYLILVTGNISKLLPTIVSRCQVISDNKLNENSFDAVKTKKTLMEILTASVGERILLSQKLVTTREEGLKFLDNLLALLEELLYKKNPQIDLSVKEIAQLLKKVSAARNYLERYINFKATLDVLFLGFPRK